MPALPTEEPIISDVRPSSVRLSWRPADIPSYMNDTTIPVTYTILCQEYPDTNWRPLVRRIPYTDYTVMGLQPNRDYAFRIQAENDFGTSKPTFPATLRRRPAKGVTSTDYTISDLSPRKDYHFRIRAYAVESGGCKIYADVKGYPLPLITWYFKGQKLDTDGGRYNLVISPVGQIDLDFRDVTWDDIGDYTCVAENEHGKAERIIPLKMAGRYRTESNESVH
ncbi:hypothetical protein LOTGIDRAFT_139483 [Lottia gigantea]|uniref:Fibronectin type-III domain-containing protein n=1 Tax=Lottia gigantea TaxID=225164 RepID=V4B222_LOTGI|nr:hypothetical protein LOTGIDRAFT_139483 [Lottia gigantea]ESP01586.1 hypothetical protein LOTGIDRAFT_139483 [Lottia gigantea]